MNKYIKRSCIVLLTIIFAPVVMAASANKNFQTTSKINQNCEISVQDISFGTYFPTQGDGFASSDINIRCTNKTSATIGINHTGQNPYHLSTLKYSTVEDGLSYARYMKSGTNRLYYNLFQDSSYSKVFGGSNWFTRTTGSRPVVVSDSTLKKVPIYAAMASGQFSKAATYLDSLIVEVVF